MTKVTPNTLLEKAARKAGHQVSVMWEQRGPVNTEVAWMTYLVIDRLGCVIIQSWKDGGFAAYPEAGRPELHQTVDDLLKTL